MPDVVEAPLTEQAAVETTDEKDIRGADEKDTKTADIKDTETAGTPNITSNVGTGTDLSDDTQEAAAEQANIGEDSPAEQTQTVSPTDPDSESEGAVGQTTEAQDIEKAVLHARQEAGTPETAGEPVHG